LLLYNKIIDISMISQVTANLLYVSYLLFNALCETI